MKYLIFIVFLSTILYSQTKTGTIKGKIIDVADSSASMAGATVFLNNNTGAVSDINGYYEIKNVPLGKQILKCYFIGYGTQRDTIELTKNNFEAKKDFYLRVLKIPIPMPDSLNEYHKLISNSKPAEVLNIFIDSLSKDYKTVYLTFTNKTKYPLYLIEDLPCFNTASIILKNENGKSINRNILNGCDVNFVDLPKRENLIKLEAFESIHFPAFQMQNYSLKNYSLPKGKYYLSLKYEIKNFKYLPGVYSKSEFDYYNTYKEEIEILNQATRGIYFSGNEIVIEK